MDRITIVSLAAALAIAFIGWLLSRKLPLPKPGHCRCGKVLDVEGSAICSRCQPF